MTLKPFPLIVIVALAIGTAACSEPDEPSDPAAGIDLEAAEMTEEKAATLSEDQLAALREKYPVLRKEPAPEPAPSREAKAPTFPREVRQALERGVLESISGEATYYADKFEGRRTASGIPFRQNQYVAAHLSYPFGTLLRVTNERNGRSVNVRVIDRGPHGAAAERRNTIIDLSRRAAAELGFIRDGRTPVSVEVLEWGEGLPRS